MKNANIVIFVGFLSVSSLASAQDNRPPGAATVQSGSTNAPDAVGGSATLDTNSAIQPKAPAPEKNLSIQGKNAGKSDPVSRADVTLGSDTLPPHAGAPLPSPTARLDSSALTIKIRQEPSETRGTLLTALDEHLENTERDVLAMKETSAHFSGAPRENFSAAFAEYKMAQKSLRSSLHAAHASSASNWPALRMTLAHDFEAYSVTLARLEATSAIAQ